MLVLTPSLTAPGVFVFGLLLSSLGDMFHRTSGGIRRAVALRDKLSNLEVWSARRGFPSPLLLAMRYAARMSDMQILKHMG